MYKPFLRSALMLCAFLTLLTLSSCSGTRQPANTATKLLLGEYSRDWLKYKIYLLPEPMESRQSHDKRTVTLSIMVVNMMDNVSPLRKRCSNLDQYNIYYDYLLNSCKNEIFLENKGSISYPVSYSFENNYDAFPFESINVGYMISNKNKDYTLTYVDRVFAQDTLSFPLNL